MPTKKKRVGFIPRSDVLDLIIKLSYENHLSSSKIINILVEESLFRRGLFNLKTGKAFKNRSNFEDRINEGMVDTINKSFTYNSGNNLLKNSNLHMNEVKEETFDEDIYDKFLMFLQFQERMKKQI